VKELSKLIDKRDKLEKAYEVAMKDFENGMRWGTEKEIEEALEHAIKVDFERNKK